MAWLEWKKKKVKVILYLYGKESTTSEHLS